MLFILNEFYKNLKIKEITVDLVLSNALAVCIYLSPVVDLYTTKFTMMPAIVVFALALFAVELFRDDEQPFQRIAFSLCGIIYVCVPFRAVAKFQYPLFKNVDFNSKLELFSNYLKNPQYVDVDWQNALVMKVNSWLNANIATQLLYDYDIPFYNETTGEKIKGSKIQFKEVLSIGFLIKL